MDFAEIFKYSIVNIKHRKLRSWLTILGIVIGIASIVVLISLAQGLDADIKKNLTKLGTNFVVIIPGNIKIGSGLSFGPPVLKGVLYTRDVNIIKRVSGVDYVSGNVAVLFAPVKFRKTNTTANVVGVDAQTYDKFITVGYESGKFFQTGDTSSVVIGNDIANGYFPDKVSLGNQLIIKGKSFRVAGIISKVGQSGGNFDNAIIVDVKAARELFPDVVSKERVSTITVITRPEADPEQVAQDISFRLQNSHKVKEDNLDFTVFTAKSVLEQIGRITGLLSLFLGAIAAISLLVGAVGIANAMFTSVLERTREIGILKAIGAPSETILKIFLADSIIISTIGGGIGVVFGALVAFAIGLAGISTSVSFEVVLFAFLLSIFVGGLSGYFPARRASRLPAVEALRYE